MGQQTGPKFVIVNGKTSGYTWNSLFLLQTLGIREPEQNNKTLAARYFLIKYACQPYGLLPEGVKCVIRAALIQLGRGTWSMEGKAAEETNTESETRDFAYKIRLF